MLAALADPAENPMALIAAEHTAQLNAPQSDDVFSKAEENELLFQDVELIGSRAANRHRNRRAFKHDDDGSRHRHRRSVRRRTA